MNATQKKANIFIIFVLIGAVLIAAGTLLSSPRILCLFIPVMITAWTALGTTNQGKISKGMIYMLSALFVIYEVSLNWMLSLDNTVAQPSFLGLPEGSAVMIYLLYVGLFLTFTLPFSKCFRSWIDIDKGEALIKKYESVAKEDK